MPKLFEAAEHETVKEFNQILGLQFRFEAKKRRKSESVTVTESFVHGGHTMLSESVFKQLDTELDDMDWAEGLTQLRQFCNHEDPEISS